MALLRERPTATSDTIPAVLVAQAARLGTAVALRRKECGIWRRISWADYARQVRRTAHALLAMGLRKGDRVGILGENRPEWLYGDLGVQSAGGVSVGIYATNSPEQVHYILEHSEARVVIVEGEEQ